MTTRLGKFQIVSVTEERPGSWLVDIDGGTTFMKARVYEGAGRDGKPWIRATAGWEARHPNLLDRPTEKEEAKILKAIRAAKSAKHESGGNPRVARPIPRLNKYGRKEPTLRQLASTYSTPKAGTSWAKATLAERRTAYQLAYPGRDVGGWDLGFADAKAAKFLKLVRYAKDHPRDPLSKRLRSVLDGK
jgi:hypothetical protein